jgi:hypothetical protein
MGEEEVMVGEAGGGGGGDSHFGDVARAAAGVMLGEHVDMDMDNLCHDLFEERGGGGGDEAEDYDDEDCGEDMMDAIAGAAAAAAFAFAAEASSDDGKRSKAGENPKAVSDCSSSLEEEGSSHAKNSNELADAVGVLPPSTIHLPSAPPPPTATTTTTGVVGGGPPAAAAQAPPRSGSPPVRHAPTI